VFNLRSYSRRVHRPQGMCPVCGAPRQELVVRVQPSLDDPEPKPITGEVCSSLLCPTNLMDLIA